MSRKASPTVFISYSWDSPRHRRWVEDLAKELTSYHAKVILDQWDMNPGESVTQFMEKAIVRADFVLAICTPSYAQKSNARQGGVGYEQQIISGRMALGLKDKRFIPIVRRGTIVPGKECAIPIHLTGLFSIVMKRTGFEGDEFDALLRALFAIPRHMPPPLRQGPIFKPRKRKNKKISVRQPHVELDGYELRSGVAASELYTKTFELPSERARQSLKKGDLAKLIFYIWDKVDKDLQGERMWVRVTGVRGVYYVGKLSNQPLTTDKSGWPLKWGDTILFLPEHVIEIERLPH